MDPCTQLPEHLKAYWKIWGENNNEKSSVKINKTMFDEIAAVLRVPSVETIPAAHPTPLAKQLPHGLRQQPDPVVPNADVAKWHFSMLLNRHSLKQSAIQYTFGVSAPAVTTNERKRKAPSDKHHDQQTIRKRKPRTCLRCHRLDCEGRFNSKPCHTDLV